MHYQASPVITRLIKFIDSIGISEPGSQKLPSIDNPPSMFGEAKLRSFHTDAEERRKKTRFSQDFSLYYYFLKDTALIPSMTKAPAATSLFTTECNFPPN